MTFDQRSRYIAAAVFGAAALALAGVWYAGQKAEVRAVEELPAAERRALYERTLRTLESSCAPRKRPDGLDHFCREQAAFIQRFPECDDTCQALARRQTTAPTR